MTEHETTEDVIAWLRRPREGENAYLTLWRDEIADRLDAAHRREIDELKKQVGNAVKLREALVLALSLLDLKEGVPYKTVSQKDLDFMKDALAAPTRNCDVYDAKTAEKEFIRQTGSKSIRSKSVRWLLAPAKEKEGGNNGNE